MNQHVFEIINILNYVGFGGIFLEYAYSLYKKDGVYATPGTMGNLLTGFAMRFLSIPSALFALGYFMTWYDLLGYEGPSDFSSVTWSSVTTLFVCLVVIDFWYYIYHRLSHKLDVLWMFHHAHHGDRRLNLSTAFRLSIFQLSFIFLFFAPALLFGFHPYYIFVAYYILAFYQYYAHSQYIKLPLWCDYILVTPHNHRIHHDQEEKNQHSNFGAVFSIWDRLFGTYTPEIETFTPGIKGYHQDDFIWIQLDPVIMYLRQLAQSMKGVVFKLRAYVQHL